MRSRLELKVAPLQVVSMPPASARSMSRVPVMSFDKIAVISVHNADEHREICRRARMQRMRQRRGSGGQLGDQVGDRFRSVLQGAPVRSA